MKETYSGSELRKLAGAGIPQGCRRASGMPDEMHRVRRLLDEARGYGLRGVEMLDAMTLEQIARAYNGIGPASFPPSMREAIDALVPDLRCVALIHDVRWAYGDGSEAQFKASNAEFAENGAVVARALHRWHPLRRMRLKGVARMFARLCSGSAGWSAYLAALKGKEGGTGHEAR